MLSTERQLARACIPNTTLTLLTLKTAASTLREEQRDVSAAARPIPYLRPLRGRSPPAPPASKASLPLASLAASSAPSALRDRPLRGRTGTGKILSFGRCAAETAAAGRRAIGDVRGGAAAGEERSGRAERPHSLS